MKLIYTSSDGRTIVLFNSPFQLSKVEGIGDVDADIQSQKSPFQDGTTYIDSLMNERPISIELKISGRDSEELKNNRRLLSSIFNPKLGPGLLQFIDGTDIKEIIVESEHVPIFPDGNSNRGETYQKAVIGLIANNPYWRSPSITEEPTFEPLFQFPFDGPFEMGVQRDERIIVNDGDAPAPLQIEFHGPAVNPIIINKTTGEYIKVNQTLGENEVMKIDTTPGQKSVYFVAADGTERNVFNWIDLGSTFFQLVIGENVIQYSADSDIQGAIVDISYSKLYVGI
jgi:hypothetical protein